VRGLLSAIAVRTGSPALATVPITTTDAPWALTPRLVAAVDILSVVVQPFYETPLDATKAGWVAGGGGVFDRGQTQLVKLYDHVLMGLVRGGGCVAAG
jgi:hypothetical protein